MTLSVVFKGIEGIVLSADSRLTVQAQTGSISFYDNATKIFALPGQRHCGVITAGSSTIPIQSQSRSLTSHLLEFSEVINPLGKLSVEDLSNELNRFVTRVWHISGQPQQTLNLAVVGFDASCSSGRVFSLIFPAASQPTELNKGEFGLTTFGEDGFVWTLIRGINVRLLNDIKNIVARSGSGELETAVNSATQGFSYFPPISSLPLRDAVDLTRFLIETTSLLQKFLVLTQTVGGPVKSATITAQEGFNWVS